MSIHCISSCGLQLLSQLGFQLFTCGVRYDCGCWLSHRCFTIGKPDENQRKTRDKWWFHGILWGVTLWDWRWLSLYLSEKYDVVIWDDDIPNIWKTWSKTPTSYVQWLLFHVFNVIINVIQWQILAWSGLIKHLRLQSGITTLKPTICDICLEFKNLW